MIVHMADPERFENKYIFVPHPFQSGDIVRIIPTDQIGIVASCRGWEAEEAYIRQIQNRGCLMDSSDIQIKVNILREDGRFEHGHYHPFLMEYADLKINNAHNQLLKYASSLVKEKESR